MDFVWLIGKCSGVQQTKVTWDSPWGCPAQVAVEGPHASGPQMAGLWLFCSLPHKDKIWKPADCLSSSIPAMNNWNLKFKTCWHTHLHTITPQSSVINLTHYVWVSAIWFIWEKLGTSSARNERSKWMKRCSYMWVLRAFSLIDPISLLTPSPSQCWLTGKLLKHKQPHGSAATNKGSGSPQCQRERGSSVEFPDKIQRTFLLYVSNIAQDILTGKKIIHSLSKTQI